MLNEKKRKTYLETFDTLKELRVLLIGDSIIDRYIYCYALGTASKDPVISTRKTGEELFAGGTLSVANNISDFVHQIDMITVLGEKKSYEDFIKNHLSKNIQQHFFYKKDSETIVKTRFLDELRLGKLFKIENTDEKTINKSLELEITSFIAKRIEKYDMVLVNDFGHGFLTKKIREIVVNHSPHLAINVQTNSSNYGFNPLSKYKFADFVTLNSRELRIYFQNNEYNKDHLFERLIKTGNYKKILLTLSKEGVIFYDGKNIKKHKAFTSRPIDTIGAGDAVFSITSLLSYINEDDLIPELADIIGAIAVRTIGNKEPITKEKILNFIGNEDEFYGMERI